MAKPAGKGQDCEKYKGKAILAPMVKIGTLASRLLSLRYGADLVYTEEIIDWRILRSTRIVNQMLGTIEYIDNTDGSLIFSTCEEEKSQVVFQMGTSDPQRALQAMKIVENDVSAVDVNMGCPKEFSLKGGMGAALLTKPDKVKAILTTLVENAKIPVTCKIRVLPTVEETLELALLIQSCGVSALAIHGRNINERQQHANRSHFIKAIAEKLEIPVIANGGSKEIERNEDIERFRKEAGSASVMIARAAEWNPSIFRKEGKVDLETIVKEFIKLSVTTANPFTNTKYSIQRMLRELQETPLGKKFLSTLTMEELCDVWSLKDFYKEKTSKWENFKKTKRPSEYPAVGNDPKKLKLSRPIDSSVIVIPDCPFIRGHYTTDVVLPKTIVLNWARSQKFSKLPIYSTEYVDKRFISIVEVGGKKIMTDVWEKSKKHAEQGAALACIKFLKLNSPDKDNQDAK